MQIHAVLSDIHFPFHSSALFELVVPFLKELELKGIHLLGDIVDMFQLSDFDKNPMTKTSIKTEQVLSAKLMREFRDVDIKEWDEGNHEDRHRRYLWAHAPALVESGLVDFPTIFRLGEHGFTHRPYGVKGWIGKLMKVHGSIVRKHSAQTAMGNFQKYGTSVICGHTHRQGSYCHTNINGQHACYENGHLSDVEKAEYIKDPDWQEGFSIVQVLEDGLFNVEQIKILEIGGRKQFIYGGERYRTVPRKS